MNTFLKKFFQLPQGGSFMPINYIDIAILCILAFFSLRGLFRGFVNELAGVLALIGGLWLAHHYYISTAEYLVFIENSTVRYTTAYVGIFILTAIAVRILAYIIHTILSLTLMSWADKVTGLLLGCIKGLILCALIIFVLEIFLGNQSPIFTDSLILPYIQNIIERLYNYLPINVLQQLKS